MTRLLRTAGVVLLLTVSACGTGARPQEPGLRPPSEGQWARDRLTGLPGPDSPTILAIDADDALIVSTSEAGAVRSHISHDGGAFEPGAALETGIDHLALGGAARLAGRWVAVGSGGLTGSGNDEAMEFAPAAFASLDGLTWEPLLVSGFTQPVDVAGLVATPDGLVAVGSYRMADDPAMGGFRATAWHSSDGAAWSAVDLPGADAGPDSYVADVVAAEDRLIATGSAGGAAMVWTSDDGGATWVASDADVLGKGYAVAQVAVWGRTIIAALVSGVAESPGMLGSKDGGGSWAAVSGPPGNAEGWSPVWSAGRWLFTTRLRASSGDGDVDPGVCYADLAQCLGSPLTDLYSTQDGDRWARVDPAGLGADDDLMAAVAGTTDGRVLVLGHDADGLVVRTWPSGVDLPSAPDPAPPATVDLVTVPSTGPRPGVRYHQPLYVHCGMDWLYLGDVAWRRTDGGPDVETGAGDQAPPSWPLAGQTLYGYATLDDHGVVEYAASDGTVMATYERTAETPGGCD